MGLELGDELDAAVLAQRHVFLHDVAQVHLG